MNLELRPLNQLGIISRKQEYVALHITGLFGDIIHASTRFKYILNKYPEHPWIIFHSYPVPHCALSRIQIAYRSLLKYLFEDGRIEYYFYSTHGRPGSHGYQIPEIMNALKYTRAYPDRYFDCVITNPKTPNMDVPYLGIEIPKDKDPKKAVILRRSTWHKHFPQRNRPMSEWFQIEKKLLEHGYTVYLVGVDDDYSNPNNLIDYRRKFNVRDVLDFTKDASICITPATFLYVWTQFICPTAVLSDRRDVNNLNTNWKLNNNMYVFDTSLNNYMKLLIDFIKSSSEEKKFVNLNINQERTIKAHRIIIENHKKKILERAAY